MLRAPLPEMGIELFALVSPLHSGGSGEPQCPTTFTAAHSRADPRCAGRSVTTLSSDWFLSAMVVVIKLSFDLFGFFFCLSM